MLGNAPSQPIFVSTHSPEHQDKTYSRDSVSFVLMRRQGIMEALTTDKHFEQEGFVRLLRSV